MFDDLTVWNILCLRFFKFIADFDYHTPMQNYRAMCYRCFRPEPLCLCDTLSPVQTYTRFVILIHPKEFSRIKNNTGRLTHLSLPNSDLFMGLDFTSHGPLNAILNDPENFCVILYPGEESLPLESAPLPENRRLVILLIDATWASAKVMLRKSTNLHPLPRVSFSHTKTSAYGFKRQPFAQALSTMESVHTVLEILHRRGYEKPDSLALAHFLDPFRRMVAIQKSFNP